MPDDGMYGFINGILDKDKIKDVVGDMVKGYVKDKYIKPYEEPIKQLFKNEDAVNKEASLFLEFIREKSAFNWNNSALIGGLGGAAVGAGSGYALTKDKEHKLRNTLIGAGAGAGAGAGYGIGIGKLSNPRGFIRNNLDKDIYSRKVNKVLDDIFKQPNVNKKTIHSVADEVLEKLI